MTGQEIAGLVLLALGISVALWACWFVGQLLKPRIVCLSCEAKYVADDVPLEQVAVRVAPDHLGYIEVPCCPLCGNVCVPEDRP